MNNRKLLATTLGTVALVLTLCGCLAEQLPTTVSASRATTEATTVAMSTSVSDTTAPESLERQTSPASGQTQPVRGTRLPLTMKNLLLAYGKPADALAALGNPAETLEAHHDQFRAIDVPLTFKWTFGSPSAMPMFTAQAQVNGGSKTVESIEAVVQVSSQAVWPTVDQAWPLLSRQEPEIYYYSENGVNQNTGQYGLMWYVNCYLKTGGATIMIQAVCRIPPVLVSRKTDFATGQPTDTVVRNRFFTLADAQITLIDAGPNNSRANGRNVEPRGELLSKVKAPAKG